MITFADKVTRFMTLKFWRLKWRARGVTLKHALRAMYYLNRVAAGMGYSGQRELLYALKQVFIEHLYKIGYVKQISQQNQTYPCWECGGYKVDVENWNNEDVCPKCGGTGIFRQHTLVKFVIQHQGRRYVWHQPYKQCQHYLGLIPYDDEPEYTGRPAALYSSTAKRKEWAYVVVMQYLRGQGVDVRRFELFPLRKLIKVRLPKWWQDRQWRKEMESDIPF